MFGKKQVPPQEQAKEWKTTIKHQSRELDKQMRKIEREEEKVKLKVKNLMKQGQQDAVLPLVQELSNSKRAKSKILKTRTQLDSMVRAIDMQIAQIKVCGAFSQSAEVTHMLNQLVSLPELNATMCKLQGEMQKAGMAAEAVDETMGMLDEENEDPELAVRLVFNEIASEVNKQSSNKVFIPLQPIEPEEIEDDPQAAALAH